MEDVIKEIYSELDKLDATQDDNGLILEGIKYVSDNIYDEIVDSDKLIQNLNQGITNIGTHLAPLIQDTELHISEHYLEKSFDEKIENELDFNLDNINITMKRESDFDILLDESMRNKTMTVQSKWKIKNSFNGSEESYFIKFYLSFKISNNQLSTFITKRTTFHNENLIKIDPFAFLPILKKHKTLKEFDKQISLKINTYRFNFDEYNSNEIKFLAKDFLFHRNKVMVFSKTLNKRKIRFPIHPLDNNYQDFTLIIRKEHIYPSISKIAKQRDAKLLSADFQNGKIVIESYGSEKKDILHISVKGRVWMKHNIYIRNGYKTLNFNASWLSWKYKIKAKRCLGVCGEVMREAKKRVMKLINQSKYFSGVFMDTSNIGKNVKCRINKNGLKFYFNKN